MKRAALAILFTLALELILTGCGGGGGGGNNQPVTSKLKNRAWVSNTYAGVLRIVDASTDKLSNFQTSVGANPTTVLLSKDKSVIVVYSAGSGAAVAYNPAADKESISASVALNAPSESLAVSDNGKMLYVAEKNATVTGQPNGAIQIANLADTTATVPNPISIPNVRWIALNHAGNLILAFSDQSNTVMKVDPTATTPAPTAVPGPFDRPIAAFFSSDDSKAYILNCGPECGGTTASVTELTIANGTTRSVAVSAATVGLLDGTTLYVAGAPAGVGGTIQAVDTGAMTASAAKTISAGLHSLMMSAGGKVWVGASNCGANKGCLSIYNTGDQSVTIDDPAAGASAKGNVTGMTPISGRSVVYIVEGGELRVYDSGTGAEITPLALDIVGQAYGVVAIP